MATRREIAEASAVYDVKSDAQFKPSKEQKAVITAPANARLLVDAGPGTGKTAVACARIAWLINNRGLEPTDIWLVSFTRTAVHELRTRIAAYVGDSRRAAGIRIATIDSHAWAIQSGFRQDASLTGSFENNISRVIDLIQNHEGVFEYLASVRHLVIDEAQDVVGPRCELCLELISALPEASGITVFSDEAQAIYGFAEEDSPGDVEGTLPEMVRKHLDGFKERELTEIHRTSDRVLKAIFQSGREILRDDRTTGAKKLTKLRELVEDTNHRKIGSHRTDLENVHAGPDTFLLFRRRGEALQASSYLDGQPHRLRMSGLPPLIHDWVGRTFWDWLELEMDRGEFECRWKERMTGRTDMGLDSAWGALVRIVGRSETRISVARLRRRLAGGSPPIDLCNLDFGPGGPIVGTIHGAKGREAAEVRVYLPPPPDGDNDDVGDAEEARVVFVAATRARERLFVGHGATKALARRLEQSGRAFTPYPFNRGKREARSCVEIGRDGDIDAEGLVGRRLFADERSARTAQAQCAKLTGKISKASAVAGPATLDYRYAVSSEEVGSPVLCYLSRRVNYDLFEIAKVVDNIAHLRRMKPPKDIKYLRVFGVRTLVVGSDDEARGKLHAPWRDSGFLLAPLVIGYSMAWFRY